MTVGIDIKEVLQDIGAAFAIKRDARSISGEYLKYTPNAQVTKPFIREFFLEAIISYDTRVVTGDVLYIPVMDSYYLVMNKTPYILENEVIRFDIVIYRSNIVINIERPSEGRSAQTYLKRTSWTIVKSNAYALLTEPLFGASLETDLEIGLIGLERGELYVPSSYNIQQLDRIRILETDEYYRVETVKKRRFPSIDVIELGEDVRPTSTTSTTSTVSTTSTTSSTASTTSTTITSTSTTTTT